MQLQELSLVNFKNYDQLDLSFSSGINCFVGNNGSGKTNLLDAIYYLSMTKSYFNSIDTQNIRHGEDFFVIRGNYERKGTTERIHCGVKKGKRKNFRRNDKEYGRISEHIGLLPVVMISPSDNALITEGSDERRRFMDAVISQYNPTYLDHLIRYNRALVQRNVLLKEFAKKNAFKASQLEVWDEQLARSAAFIYPVREQFIRDILPVFAKYYDIISGKQEEVKMEYNSQLSGGDEATLLKDSRDKDRILQYTTAGVHKDDLSLSIDGHPIKRTGSQGQQKTFLVALKFAKSVFMSQVNGFHPVMLLDDVFDKFDSERVREIISLVSGDSFGQIFITDTNRDRIRMVLDGIDTEYRLFDVDGGKVSESK